MVNKSWRDKEHIAFAKLIALGVQNIVDFFTLNEKFTS